MKKKIKKFSEPPRAIIITFSAQFFYEIGITIKTKHKLRKNGIIQIGYLSFLRQIKELSKDENGYWNHTLANPPAEYTENLQHCYISILGKIRFKADILQFERAKKGETIRKMFDDGRSMESKGWLLLNNFVKTKEFPKNGFQGFRYVIPGSEIDKL